MEKKKKAKPMTAREKKERAEIRKDLRERGILPPKKKPLNRKVFAERAKEALKKQAGYTLNLYLHWALLEMLEKQDYSRPGAIVYSQEAVGAAKVVLLAVPESPEKRITTSCNSRTFDCSMILVSDYGLTTISQIYSD